MGFSRKDIYGTSPLDIKNLNDNLKYMWKKVFGNITTGDIMPGSITKKTLSKEVVSDIETTKKSIETTKTSIDQLEKDTDSEVQNIKSQMNELNTKKVSNDTFTSTITQLNNAIFSCITSEEFHSYILQTDQKIASKVSNDSFSSFVTQTATALSTKVSNSDFTSYKQQTSNSISSVITEQGVLKTMIRQNQDGIDLIVNGSSLDGDAIVSAINVSSSRIRMSALNIDLDGYVTISDLRNGRTTIDGGCISTGTISANRLDIDEICSQINHVGRFVYFSTSSSLAGIGLNTDNDLWLYASNDIIFECSRVKNRRGDTYATQEWVLQQLGK